MDKFYWLNEESRQFLSRGYLLPGVTVEERIEQIGKYAESILGIDGFSDKFYDYMSRGWFSLSTPVWANFGLDRGLGISCFGVTIKDDLSDILRASCEIGMLCKYGGGTAGYFGNLRHRGSEIKNNGFSSGAVHFMEIFETIANTISQGSARRGHFAAYLPASHPDVMEFLNIKDEGNNIQDISIAVTVDADFKQRLLNRDPEAENIWVRIIQKRFETGYPYIFFEDNVNNNKPQVYKDAGLDIKHSQMCSEILEYTDEQKSFTCCLSSMNLLHFDEWKDTDAVEILTYLLDSILTDFINRAKNIPFLEKTVLFAEEHRSIGLGVLGYHSYLQSKMIPFEGIQAQILNNLIFKNINDKSLKASKFLATRFGEPKMLKGYGERFTTRLAIAPTTSSSFILGQVSPSIEPLNSNYFLKDLAKGKFPYRNPYLKEVLSKYEKDTEDTWHSILMHGGSVQHLKFLSDEEKMVFKTFGEISQLEIVRQAASRQKHIDQGQSLNLMIHPDTPVHEVHSLLMEAWDLGIKTLYYQRSANKAQEVSRDLMNCVSCEA
jgi:ribonucleoside-diphosphate reductase alpha chain